MLRSTSARVVACCLVAVVGLAVTLSADHSWGNYHWARSSNPFTLKLGDNVTSAWDSHLAVASSDWSQSSVLDTTIVPGSTTSKRCRPTAGRIEVCNDRYGFNGWLGIAQIWASGDHITQAVTKLNDSYFNTSTYNKPEWRQLVMCQEVGHDFGLDHQDEDFGNSNMNTCMDYTNSPLSNQHPNDHDYVQLESIYAHLDSTTTVGSSVLPNTMPPAMGLIAFDTPAQWGRRIHRTPNGRQEVYELDFGRGNKVITHVFWADPDADAQ